MPFFLLVLNIKIITMKKSFLLFIIIVCSLITQAQFITYPPELLGGSFNKKLVYDQEFYYPEKAKDFDGECKISFIIDTQGKAYEFIVAKSIHPQLDSAYISLLKHYIWIPGTKDGQVAAMKMHVSRKFKYKKFEKLVKRRGYKIPPNKYIPYDTSLYLFKSDELEKSVVIKYKDKEVKIFDFIRDYIKIPDAALKQGIKGIVELEFVVEASGRINNFKEIQGVGGGCTEEAIRLMQMLQFEPGKQNGKYVRSCYNITVNFGNTRY